MKRVTIEDVAAAAGVSRQTVSRAINDKPEISVATKQRVMEAVAELGYRPNRMAQGMVTQRTRTVGLVVPDITNPFFPEVARGVQDIARANEYNVVLCNTDAKPEQELETLELLMAQGVDGIITFGTAGDEELRRFADKFRPIIFINRPLQHTNINLLMVNNGQGARSAAEFFIRQGHAQIAMVTSSWATYNQNRRLHSFKQTLLEHDLLHDEHQIVANEATLEGGYAATHQLFSHHPDTTAIFAYNDVMALGALRACQELDKAVPEDVSIIGFDDIALMTMVTPQFSCVHVDKYEIGNRAMLRILEMLDNPEKAYPNIEISVALKLRGSTRPEVES